MHLNDLLQVLRDEHAQAGVELDTALGAWMGDDPANAPAHVEAVSGTLGRLAHATRVVGLEGVAVVLEQMCSAAQLVAMSDAEAMAQGLAWLAMSREPLQATYQHLGDAGAAAALVAYLESGPAPPDVAAAAGLRALLVAPHVVPADDEPAAEAWEALQPDDVSIALPDDVDQGLLDLFLAEAPAQLAGLGDTVRALARAPVNTARLLEAQRVAHTFKGSSHIIGIRGIGKLAHRVEDLLEFSVAQGGSLPRAMADDLAQAVATLDQMVYALRGEEEAPAQAMGQLARLVDWVAAIRRGDWADWAAQAAQADQAGRAGRAADTPGHTQAALPGPAVPPETGAAAEPLPAAASDDVGPQIRVSAARLDALVRQAGQSLVQQGRQAERLSQMDQRLAAMQAAQATLVTRLRDLQMQIDRRGVSLQEKAGHEGASFDPLEMDRYNELHALTRFVAEVAADSGELAAAAREELRHAARDAADHEHGLRAQHGDLLRARLVPFRQIAARLRRNVSQTAAATGKRAELVIEGEQVQFDSDVLERLTEPLMHLLRNAVDHGIETADERTQRGKPAEGTVHLAISRDGQAVRIACRDDGHGLDLPVIEHKARQLGLLATEAPLDADNVARLILLPGFSTRNEVSAVSGRGIGMDVVAERVRAMKGHLDIASRRFEGTTFTLSVPATTGAALALVVQVAGQLFALPTDRVVTGLAAGQGELRGDHLHVGDSVWRHTRLADVLGLPEPEATKDDGQRPAVVVRGGRDELALWVDRVIEVKEFILQDAGRLLNRLRGVVCGALRPDGRVMFVLDMDALGSTAAVVNREAVRAMRQRMHATRRRVLVVDDSLSVRKTLSQLLGDAGYQVRTARDGFDALESLAREPTDIVLTDLEMPNLDGLNLTRHLRESDAWRHLPVVMITSRGTDKHRVRAQEVGVSAYLTKPYGDPQLLALVQQLVAGGEVPHAVAG